LQGISSLPNLLQFTSTTIMFSFFRSAQSAASSRADSVTEVVVNAKQDARSVASSGAEKIMDAALKATAEAQLVASSGVDKVSEAAVKAKDVAKDKASEVNAEKITDAAAKAAAEAQILASSGVEKVSEAAMTAKEMAKGKANEFTKEQLKTLLEGSRQQECEVPEVWVEILEVDMSHGWEASDINITSLKGLHIKSKIEVIGTVAQLAGMVAARGAESAMGKVDAGESLVTRKFGLPSLGIGAFAARNAAKAKTNLAGKAASGSEIKSAEFNMNVDLQKTFGVAEVVANVQILDSSSDALKKYLSDTIIQRYAEDALSKRITRDLSSLHKEHLTVAKATEAVQNTATQLGSKISEYVVAGTKLEASV